MWKPRWLANDRRSDLSTSLDAQGRPETGPWTFGAQTGSARPVVEYTAEELAAEQAAEEAAVAAAAAERAADEAAYAEAAAAEEADQALLEQEYDRTGESAADLLLPEVVVDAVEYYPPGHPDHVFASAEAEDRFWDTWEAAQEARATRETEAADQAGDEDVDTAD